MKKISLSVFMTLVIIGICNVSSNAMSPTDSTNADYLKTHGYSPEMIKLVNMQKSRIEQDGNTAEGQEDKNVKNTIWNSKAMKTVKHWFKTSDCTMSPDFGNDNIKF